MSSEFLITFPGESAAERSKIAAKLQDALRQIDGVERVAIVRERPDSMDAGTIVSIVLAAPAVGLTVKALAAWLVRNNQTGLTITTRDGTMIINNMKSSDAPAAIDAFSKVLNR